MHDKIKCSLVPRTEYTILKRGKTKCGRYLSSCFWDVPEYGSKRWAVGVYIKVEDQSLLDASSAREIASACVNYLNIPPKRKKYSKKKPTPKYGCLELYSAKLIKRDEQNLISAVVLTGQRKNKLFWGKGVNV